MKIICAGYGKTGTKSQDRNNRTGKLTWHRQSCHFFILSNFHRPGIGKTGTSSITKALRHLGFKVFDFEEQTFDSLCSQTSCQEPQICLTSRPTKSSLTTQMVRKTLPPVKEMFNPLTPGALSKKMRCLDIFVVFRLDLGQISFNLIENGFATQQLAFLTTSIAFYHIVTRACAEIEKVAYAFRLFNFWNFFSLLLFLLFFSFCSRDLPSTGLASG